jgi:hypothetical protein
MKKLIQSLQDYRMPKKYSRSDWHNITWQMFRPFFRRPTQLKANFDAFHIELRNLARIALHKEFIELLKWNLLIYRRVIRNDRSGAYQTLIELFDNISESDNRWLNMFETSAPLARDAPIQDHAYQLFTTIDGVAEGCYKPQLQVAFAFAVRASGGGWPTNVRGMNFGGLVANYPSSLKSKAGLLLEDPDMHIPVNQWRNIAAHRDFKIIGPRTVQVSFGTTTQQTRRFSLARLRKVWHWLLRAHTAARLTNTIIYIEHMPELYSAGLRANEHRMSATLLGICHSLATVGFECLEAFKSKGEFALLVRDRHGRNPKEALIHASQMLDQLSVGLLLDLTTQRSIERATIGLVLPDGSRFGTATVPVKIADMHSLGHITLDEYMNNIHWQLY